MVRRWLLSLLKILISVVVGALLLAGLYMLFNDTILPTLTTRIKELFDYKG
jgi:lipopolysaccharide export LptBFGC system permease protein LptF